MLLINELRDWTFAALSYRNVMKLLFLIIILLMT